MGILGFYGRWIRSRNFKGLLQSGLPPFVSSLSIDMNSLIHNAAQIVYAYGIGKNNARLNFIKSMDPQDLESDFFLTIGTKIMEIVNLVRPYDTLVLAVDGVAPKAKINQQRQRRYRSAKNPASNIFDTNSITPGTDIMLRLDEFIKKWIAENQQLLPPKVIYSSHNVAGEGEHKIFDLMRFGEIPDNGPHVLHGLDADLFMLSMLAPFEKIYLIRDRSTEIVSISILKKGINKELNSISGYNDFVVMMFFFGNDFIPGQPSLYDINTSIDSMIGVYKELKQNKNFNGLTKGDEINWDGMTMFLEKMSQKEPSKMNDIAKIEFKYPSKMINQSVTLTQMAGQPIKKSFNFDKFRIAWYSNSLGPKGDIKSAEKLLSFPPYQVTQERIISMIINYMTGLSWNYLYYKKGTNAVNADYLYETFYSPLFIDLYNVVNIYRGNYLSPYIAIGENKMFGIPEQLLAVLPPSSQNLLPYEIQSLMNSNSIITDMFPRDFIVENYGKNDEFHGIAILPPVESERLIQAVNLIKWSPERSTLYGGGTNIIFKRELKPTEKYERPKYDQSQRYERPKYDQSQRYERPTRDEQRVPVGRGQKIQN
jgi:5'-3' exoribonuclease 1